MNINDNQLDDPFPPATARELDESTVLVFNNQMAASIGLSQNEGIQYLRQPMLAYYILTRLTHAHCSNKHIMTSQMPLHWHVSKPVPSPLRRVDRLGIATLMRILVALWDFSLRSLASGFGKYVKT